MHQGHKRSPSVPAQPAPAPRVLATPQTDGGFLPGAPALLAQEPAMEVSVNVLGADARVPIRQVLEHHADSVESAGDTKPARFSGSQARNASPRPPARRLTRIPVTGVPSPRRRRSPRFSGQREGLIRRRCFFKQSFGSSLASRSGG